MQTDVFDKKFPGSFKKVLSQQKTQYRKIYEQLPFYWLCSISTPLKNCKKIPKMFTSSFPWKILNTTSKILFGYGLGFTKKINLSKCFTFLTTNIQSWTVFEFPWKHFFFAKVFFFSWNHHPIPIQVKTQLEINLFVRLQTWRKWELHQHSLNFHPSILHT